MLQKDIPNKHKLSKQNLNIVYITRDTKLEKLYVKDNHCAIKTI